EVGAHAVERLAEHGVELVRDLLLDHAMDFGSEAFEDRALELARERFDRGARSSLTTSVSTGTSPAGRVLAGRFISASRRLPTESSLIGLREVVAADLVAALAIEAETGATLFLVFLACGHDFQQPGETLEVRRALGTEVEQQLA